MRYLMLALALLLSLPLYAQALIPGVGIPGVPPDFERRSVPESQWRGHYAELYQFTVQAVRHAWEANHWGTRNSHDGRATQAELDWVVVHEPRHGAFYRRFYHEYQPGGTRETALVLDQATAGVAAGFRKIVESSGTSWKLGLFSYPNPIWGWTTWIDNRLPPEHPVNAGIGGTPPPPAVSCGGGWRSNPTAADLLMAQRVPDLGGLSGVCCFLPGSFGAPGWATASCYTVAPPPPPPPPPGPECGDGTCDPGEGCETCPSDCGECEVGPPVEPTDREQAIRDAVEAIRLLLEARWPQ